MKVSQNKEALAALELDRQKLRDADAKQSKLAAAKATEEKRVVITTTLNTIGVKDVFISYSISDGGCYINDVIDHHGDQSLPEPLREKIEDFAYELLESHFINWKRAARAEGEILFNVKTGKMKVTHKEYYQKFHTTRLTV